MLPSNDDALLIFYLFALIKMQTNKYNLFIQIIAIPKIKMRM